MMRTTVFSLVGAFLLLCNSLPAAITSVEETNPDEMAAIIATNFGEDALTFSDRTHEHNGAAFNDLGVLSTSGTNIVPLPSYLLGHDYVRFANDARGLLEYSATVTTDVPSRFYLLVDNRVNGPANDNSSTNSTDPVLGGGLQWVIDGGWERVNTGISPNAQADYTGVDESGADNGTVGPGVGLNQFYAVYTLPNLATSVMVESNNIGGNNMISLVAAAIPEPSTWALAVMAAVGGLAIVRRRK